MRLSPCARSSASTRTGLRAPITEDQRAHPVIEAIHRRRDRGIETRRADRRATDRVGDRGRRDARRGVGRHDRRDRAARLHRLRSTRSTAPPRGRSRRLPARRPGRLSDRVISARVRQSRLRRAAGSLLRRRPVFDMDYVVHEVWRHQRPLRIDEILSGGIELHLHRHRCRYHRTGRPQPAAPTTRRSGRDPGLRAGCRGWRARRCRSVDVGWLDPTLSSAIPIDAPRRTTAPTCSCCRRARTGCRTRRCRDRCRG